MAVYVFVVCIYCVCLYGVVWLSLSLSLWIVAGMVVEWLHSRAVGEGL